jgi:hypothetical protein
VPLAPPCNRQRPFFVADDRQGFPFLVRAPRCNGAKSAESVRPSRSVPAAPPGRGSVA